MATYPGMSLRGEIRESVSLDEDDLSDVEDEVFIRDGKNGYKFEDMSAKKPLMAPRRKAGKSDFSKSFRNRPQCNALCKLCCYSFIALTILIGLIILVIILVTLFPLPLDKFKDWIILKTNEKEPLPKLVPCNNLEITDVWAVNFPKLISDTSVQTVDVNQDGIKDIIFGFGTNDDNALPPDVFCNIFMGTSPPCRGGVIALNGIDGQILWRYWLPHSVYSLICDVDVSGDNITDCLITGKDGILTVLNAQNGTLIWKFSDKTKESSVAIDIYLANFIPDQDNDSIPDILAAHTSQKDDVKSSHIIVISGKNGTERQRIDLGLNTETYYTPQLFLQGASNYSVLFGTGGPTTAGSLNLVSLNDILNGSMTPKVLYSDLYKGILSLAIIVDITGDGQDDIVAAMFNTTIVAIDGKNFTQLWNFTIENSETLSVPTPGYFNNDNVTDFLVKYQTGHGFPVYYFSQTFIIDGKTGSPIYTKPIIDNVGSQMGGLTIGFEGYGYDLFMFWIADCKNHEDDPAKFEFVPGTNVRQQGRSDFCKLRFNSSMVSKFYALNQFDQPPGIEIYNSEHRVDLEYNNTKPPIDELSDYLKSNPDAQFHSLEPYPPMENSYLTTSEDYEQQSQEPFKNPKYKGSNFRHKDNGQGLIRDFGRDNMKRRKNPEQIQQKYENDYDQPPDGWQKTSPYINEDVNADYNSYFDEADPPNMFPPSKLLLNTNKANSNRDPRSKTEIDPTANPPTSTKKSKTLKKNLSDTKSGVYDFKNVQKAHSRLLHDLNTSPSEILRDTYLKNRESQLKKSRFEQRDLKSHEERIKENEDIKKVIESEKIKLLNASETLWDLESEKEIEDRENGLWRGKRSTNFSTSGFSKFTSVGALVPSLNVSKNSIDLILITYWIRPKKGSQILLPRDFQCINDKLKQELDSKESVRAIDKEQLEELFMKDCLRQRGVRLKALISNNVKVGNENLRKFPYFNQIAQLGLGQMTIYRLQLECVCKVVKKNEKCVKILDSNKQHWNSYLGKHQNGVFRTEV